MSDDKQTRVIESNERSSKYKKRDQSSRNGIKNRSPRARKRKRRIEASTEKLPTPPPDPRELEKTSGERSAKRKINDDENNKENQCNSSSNSASPRSSIDITSSGNAFQQLDRLHWLMEQLLELRAKNARLFHRVRELERFKALKRLEASSKRSFLQCELEPLSPDEDVGFAESLLSAMLESSSTSSNQSSAVAVASASQELSRVKSFRAPMVRQRSRSIGTEGSSSIVLQTAKRSSCHLQYNGSREAKRNSIASSLGLGSVMPKVSKWTKVKAAFKWERAGTGTSLGNLVVEALEHDAANRLLKIPDAHQDIGNVTNNTTPSGSYSPRTVEHSAPPSPATISSSSSIDDIYGG